MGVSSTAAMAGVEHPAAQYCRDMGEGWFLPSQNELLLICNNKSTLGASYMFDANKYWSATESSNDGARVVNFTNGKMSANGKANIGSRVRCVRAI